MTPTINEMFREADHLLIGPAPTEDVIAHGRRGLRRQSRVRTAGAMVLVAATVATTVVLIGHAGGSGPDAISPVPGKRFTMGELQRATASIFKGVPGMPDPRVVAYIEVPASQDHLVVASASSVSLSQLKALTSVPITKVRIDPEIAQFLEGRPDGPGIQRPFRVARAAGKVAYVDGALLDALTGKSGVTSPAAALAWQRQQQKATWLRRLIPVATKDGLKVLGSFPIERSRGSTVTSREPRFVTVRGRLVSVGGAVSSRGLNPVPKGTVRYRSSSGTFEVAVDKNGLFETKVRQGRYYVEGAIPGHIGGRFVCATFDGSPVTVTGREPAVTVYCQFK